MRFIIAVVMNVGEDGCDNAAQVARIRKSPIRSVSWWKTSATDPQQPANLIPAQNLLSVVRNQERWIPAGLYYNACSWNWLSDILGGSLTTFPILKVAEWCRRMVSFWYRYFRYQKLGVRRILRWRFRVSCYSASRVVRAPTADLSPWADASIRPRDYAPEVGEIDCARAASRAS